ncbi:hypothetical protein DFP93_11751 [Aneurinibacillus soli]|uniref:Uncharacterized protein n=1 Tax=Aneurinibacillus soli TaxID=1500254 RepID=A0A0U5BC47_9BACL|nr:hypothetical protein [Aneurinibacillus soli]PYE59480.1 hypothetical protein DFP93_11751 [Aneurinibacillus soli]BAU29190.1 hypothetical protein CB4_03371 [Aneurinibacillus soli]
MWVRNIVWFILLIGIVMFSLLLFLLVMNPTSDYQTTEQTVSNEKATGGAKEHSPKAEAVEQPASASEDKHVSPTGTGHTEVSPSTSSHEAGATPAASSSAKQETAHGESKQESPPTVRADGDSSVSLGYLFGIGSGYFALLCTLVPYGLFMFSGRLQRSRLQALPFFMLLSITVVVLHGGIMLRVIQEWDRHLLAGVGAFACLLIFYMRVSLYTPGVYRRNNPFVVLVVAILLFVIIHAIG